MEIECASCRKELPIGDFQKCKRKTNGIQTYCKSCQLEKVKNPRSVIDRIWSGQTKLKEVVIEYTKEELIVWLMEQGYTELYNKYKEKDYNKDIIPCVDRIDPRKTFNFENIQLTTFKLKVLKKSLDAFLLSDKQGVKKSGSLKSPRYITTQTIENVRIIKYFPTYFEAVTWKKDQINNVKKVLTEFNVQYPEY